MLFAFIVAALATSYVFRHILRFPGRLVHELGGDGMKNYFSYMYHSMYGRGWWFDGMNYPYGEHIMFVDGQPILTLTLSWLRQLWHFTPETLNVILNLLMLSAFFLAILYVYKILAKMDVPYWWAMLFAPLIVTLSMQNFRIFGLYGLSYACVVPMIFYWFLHYHETGKWKYMLYLFLLSGIVMFLHPYQFALIIIWSVLYITGYLLLIPSSWKQKLHQVIPIIVVLICGIVLLKSVLHFTDPVTDRPEYPHGLLSYGTTGVDIFTNAHSPYWAWLQEKRVVTGPMGNDAQSYAYTGVVPILVIAGVLITALVFLVRRRTAGAGRLLFGVQPIWLFIAAGALLFSMGVPFVWGMEWAYDYISSLRQFRFLGWFALLFYYVITVFSVVVIYRLSAKVVPRNQWARQLLIIFPLCTWAYEAWGIEEKIFKRSTEGSYYYDFFYSKLEKDWSSFLNDNGYHASDFQAILHLPYHHVGSEKIWLSHAIWGLCVSMKAAFQLQLPLVDANMSRSSWAVTFEQVKVGAGPYSYKALFHQAKDNRRFLLLKYDDDELTPDERYLFNHADSIGINSNLVVYALDPAQLAALEKKEWKRIKTSSDTDSPYYYEPFAKRKDMHAIFGMGSKDAVSGKDTTIARIDVLNWPKDKLYEASAWFLVNNNDYRTPTMEMKLADASGTEINALKLICGEANDTHGMWFRPSKYFMLPEGCSELQIILNNTIDIKWYKLDEIMIRAATDTVVMKDNRGRIMVNNHLLPNKE